MLLKTAPPRTMQHYGMLFPKLRNSESRQCLRSGNLLLFNHFQGLETLESWQKWLLLWDGSSCPWCSLGYAHCSVLCSCSTHNAVWVMLIVWCFALLLCVLPSHKFLENVQARDFLMQKLYALRRPKTNIQILQQNVLLKYKSVRIFFYGVSVVDSGVWSKLVI